MIIKHCYRGLSELFDLLKKSDLGTSALMRWHCHLKETSSRGRHRTRALVRHLLELSKVSRLRSELRKFPNMGAGLCIFPGLIPESVQRRTHYCNKKRGINQRGRDSAYFLPVLVV